MHQEWNQLVNQEEFKFQDQPMKEFMMGLEFEEKRVEVKGKCVMQSYLLSAIHHVSTKIDLVEVLQVNNDEDDHF